MAENVVISFQADTTGLQPAISLLEKLGQIDKATADKFRQETQSYQQQLAQRANATTAAFANLDRSIKSIKVDNTLAKALDQSAPVTKTANSVSSLRQQVRQATAEAVLLSQKFGDLDPRAVAAAQAAAKLKDQLQDVNARINALNPEGKFTAIAQLAGGIAGAFTAAQGALALFGAESEDVQKALLKVQGALALSQGINQVLGLKDAFTNLKAVLGLTTAATLTQTAATEGQAVASEGAAVATTALNNALKVNPILIAVGAITALAGAYLLLSENSDEAAQNTREIADARVEAFKSVERERIEVQLLVKEFGNENTSRSRKKEIIDELQAQYPAYFKNLNSETATVDQVSEAYGRLTKALIVKAQIDALVQKIADVNIQNFEAQAKGIDGQVSKIEQFFLTLLGGAGVQQIVKSGTDRLAESQAEATKQTRFFEEAIKSLQKELDNLGGDPNKRISDNKAALDTQKRDTENYFDNALSLIDLFFNEEQARNAQSSDDLEFVAKQDVETDRKRYREKIAAAVRFGKDYSQFLKQLQELNAKNPVTPTVKLDPVGAARSLGFTDEDIANAQDQAQAYYQSEEERLQQNLDETRRLEGLKQDVRQQVYQQSLAAFSSFLDGQFELQAQANERQLEQQQEQIDAEAELNKSRYDKGLIGIKEFRDTEKRIEEERKKAADDARKREIDLKRKQDIATRAQAIFEIGVATARNIAQQPGPFGSLVPFWVKLGAAQSAAVIARPLPKYQKGTLSLQRGNNPTGTDTIPILANEGEAIIPTDKSIAYRPTLDALYHGKISPKELNAMVTYRLKEGKGSKPFTIDYDTLANKLGSEIAWRIKDGRVRVTNFGELASVLSTDNVFNRNR